MNYKYYVTLILVCIIFSACTNHYYAPVMLNNNAYYQSKPLSTDSSKSATYVFGGVATGVGIDNIHDYFNMGQLGVDEAHTFQNVNIAYGVFGALGSYGGDNLLSSGEKSFAVLSGRFSGNFSVPVGKLVDFRLLGVEVAYSKEYGDYSAFRNMAINIPNNYVDNNTEVFTGGLTSEVAWRGRSGVITYAVRGYIGKAFGNHSFNNYTGYYNINTTDHSVNIAGSFFMQINKKYCIYVDKQSLVNTSVRFGYRF